MQGTTPRALTWSGLLAVLGLSATMLPLSPTWAQRPDDKEAPALAAAPDKPEARDPGPRPEADPDPDPKPAPDPDPKPKPKVRVFAKPEVRVFRYSKDGKAETQHDEAIAKSLEELQSAINAIREKAGKLRGEGLDERQREELERAVEKMKVELHER